MEYLNRESIQSLSSKDFKDRKPYPWLQINNILTADGYELLRRTLPPIELFERQVGVPRPHGLAPHDRYLLHFRTDTRLEQPWREFIDELKGPVYKTFLRQMLGVHTFIPTFEWYYTWEGCGIPPQCDAPRRLATQLFYFNTEEDWQPAWGGQILILDSKERFSPDTEPGFEQFNVSASVEALGNGSLLLQRTPHSWHGVRPLACPPDKLRRLFIVTVNVPGLQVAWRRMRGRDADGYRLKAA